MRLTIVEEAKRSVPKFKHVQASDIWAFVHGRGELNHEEQNHLKRCDHCEAISKYFAVYVERQVAEVVEQDSPQAA
jgi:hypothetical protein